MSKKTIWGFGPVIIIIIIFIVLIKLNTVNPVSKLIQNREVEITILATADLHGNFPDTLAQYIQENKEIDKNLILVDAGDFIGSEDNPLMKQWFNICVQNPDSIQRRMPPIVREMGQIGYDAVVLGNHEFVSNDKASLDEMVLDFTDCSIPVLSANLYGTEINSYTNDYYRHYVNPYIIKEIETEQGSLKVGIIGLTIKEVGESLGQQELIDMPEYGGRLVLKDLVPEAAKLVELLRLNGVDVIIVVVHSGEEPLKPKNPGNKVKELASNVSGIDAIVAAHTHVNIPEHKYKNKSGGSVIVTQPGKWGEYCSKINLVLIQENGKWKVKDIFSLTQKM